MRPDRAPRPGRRRFAAAVPAALLGRSARPAGGRGAGPAGLKGINGNELHALDDATLHDTIAAYRALGVRWVRFDFDWSAIQPDGPRGWALERFDSVVDRLADAGMAVLGLLAYTPAWARRRASTKFHPPADPREFAEFAGRLATRYRGRGVRAWEIWNEPNLGRFWRPIPDAAGYVRLLSAASTAIRAADPTATIVTGGLAQPRRAPDAIDAVGFVRALYAHGASGTFDALGNHPYTAPAIPGDGCCDNWSRMDDGAASVRGLMRAHGDAGKPVWITEYGAPTHGRDAFGTTVPEPRQARMLEAAYREAARADWIGPVFWYNLRDFCPPAQDSSTECHYGLLRHDGSPKPAWHAFRSIG
ncbi:MAG TPA: cellulase family glycosylhydrolase [Burkholderiaceae bacterium]|nr:cellulase family glycosylhydrolase [Burkholderiaceae bacterium]